MIGLEKEFFLVNSEGKPEIIPSNIPMDESGILAEARGQPFNNATEAVYSLMADIERLKDTVDLFNNINHSKFYLVDLPYMKVDRVTRIELSRRFTKPITKYQNLYGWTSHQNTINEHCAGIHISFTEQQTITLEAKTITYNVLFDFPTIFRKLDSYFASTIKEAKRRQGFYEVKTDGRVEYRSLPANTPLQQITAFFKTLKVRNE